MYILCISVPISTESILFGQGHNIQDSIILAEVSETVLVDVDVLSLQAKITSPHGVT